MFIPLGSCPQTPCLSRLAVARKPSIYPAWRAPNSESCMGKSLPPLAGGRGSHEKNARIFFMVPGKVAEGRKGEYKPSVYPAWLPPTNPVFTPLGGCPQTQRLSRLAATRKPRVYPAWRPPHKPSVYPAWQPPTNPVFVPLGSRSRTQRLSRLTAFPKPSVYPAWRPPANPAFIPLGAPTNPAFIPLGGRPQTQRLSLLAAAHKPSIYPAWRPAQSFSNS